MGSTGRVEHASVIYGAPTPLLKFRYRKVPRSVIFIGSFKRRLNTLILYSVYSVLCSPDDLHAKVVIYAQLALYDPKVIHANALCYGLSALLFKIN